MKIPKKKRTPLEVWNLIALSILLLYILFLVQPLFNLLKSSVIHSDGGFTLEYFKKFFSQKYYLSTLINSFKVSTAVTVFSLLIGIPLAYFYNLYEIKGKKPLEILIILCSMSAPFIGAYAWILLLGRQGLITKTIEAILPVTVPRIYGFNGIVLVLVTRLFPLVFLYVSGALKSIDNSLLEASENLGVSGMRRFFTVVMPLCMPSILAAALLVFMRSMADFGTPLLIGEGYRTFPVEIYNQYVGETSVNHNFAAAISVVAIVITALVFYLQKFVASHYRFSMNSLNTIERKKIHGIKNVLIHFYAYFLVFISLLPQIYLFYMSFRKTSSSGSVFTKGFSLDSYKIALKRMSSAIPNTIFIGGVSVLVVLFLAVLVAYLVVRRENVITNTIDTLSMLPYIIPGSVVGIALVITFSKRPLVLTGTATIMIIAMIVRRIPYTIRSSVAILQQIPMSVEEAGISLGASKLQTFFKITVPMMKNGILSGGILSWITIITELSTSIILYTSHTVTLTLSIYIFVVRGTEGPAAAMATILTLFTTLSLILFIKVSDGKEMVM
ncbi:MAG: iron ABC transporter permease [Sphaerochaeta sp.]|nr:iron ABC transporter permease [Sphaerochaeta sp.]